MGRQWHWEMVTMKSVAANQMTTNNFYVGHMVPILHYRSVILTELDSSSLTLNTWYHVVVTVTPNPAVVDPTSDNCCHRLRLISMELQVSQLLRISCTEICLSTSLLSSEIIVGRLMHLFNGWMKGFYYYDYSLPLEAIEVHYLLPRPPIMELTFSTDPRLAGWVVGDTSNFHYNWIAADGFTSRDFGVESSESQLC